MKNLGGLKERFFAALRMTNNSLLIGLWYQMILNLNGEIVWPSFDHEQKWRGEQITPRHLPGQSAAALKSVLKRNFSRKADAEIC